MTSQYKREYIDTTKIEKDPFYIMIKEMPKGGLLHAHFAACANMIKFIKLIRNTKPLIFSKIYYLKDQQTAVNWLNEMDNKYKDNQNWKNNKEHNFPSDYKRFGNVTYTLVIFPDGKPCNGWENIPKDDIELEKIVSLGTRMQNLNDYDFEMGLEKYTDMYSSIVKNSLLFEDFFRFTLNEAYEDGLQIIELKKNIGSYITKETIKIDNLFFYVCNAKEEDKIKQEIEVLYKISEEMKDKIFCKIIEGVPKGLKGKSDVEAIKNKIKAKCNRHKTYDPKYKQLISGIDIYGEEDKSNNNIEYINMLLNECDLNYYPHAGETDAPVKNYNLEAIVMLTQNKKKVRIGHGLALAFDNKLMEIYKQVNIHVELCPLSNYILGYSDIKNHKGIKLYKNNVRVSINSDDPSIYGYDYVSYDWYFILKNWNLEISDIVNLCRYSIEDSSLLEEDRKKAWTIYENKFGIWITKWGKKFKESLENFKKNNLKGKINTIIDQQITILKPEPLNILKEMNLIKTLKGGSANYMEKYLKYKKKYLNLKKNSK